MKVKVLKEITFSYDGKHLVHLDAGIELKDGDFGIPQYGIEKLLAMEGFAKIVQENKAIDAAPESDEGVVELETKAIDESPENKAIDAAPENKSVTKKSKK